MNSHCFKLDLFPSRSIRQWHLYVELNSKRLYRSSREEIKKVVVLFSRRSQNVKLETLRSRFGHFTANAILWLTVSCYPSAHIWDLRFAGGSLRRPCLFLSSTYYYFCWEIVFKITFFWNRIRYSIIKKLCGISLTSGAWSSRTNVNLKPQTWQQGPDHVTFWRLRFAENAKKPRS